MLRETEVRKHPEGTHAKLLLDPSGGESVMNYQQNIQKLEQIYNYKPEPPQNRPNRTSWLKKMRRSLVTALSHNSEMRVWKTADRTGCSLWKLYDPITGETFDFNSENEVRTWIEESHNRLPIGERSFRPFYS